MGRRNKKSSGTRKSNPLPASPKKTSVRIDIILAVVFFAIPMGWSVSGFEAHIALACVFWLCAYLAIAHAFWEASVINNRSAKALIIIGVLGILVYGLRPTVLKEYQREHAPPSFVFVAPFLWINDNTWDFIVQHRGIQSNHGVEIDLNDEIKSKMVIGNKRTLTVDDVNSYDRLFRFPEIDPMGRQSIYATDFRWTPSIADHESYGFTITSAERSEAELLKIERIDGKWFYDISVKDRESGAILLDCQDVGFPDKREVPPCFPTVIKNE